VVQFDNCHNQLEMVIKDALIPHLVNYCHAGPDDTFELEPENIQNNFYRTSEGEKSKERVYSGITYRSEFNFCHPNPSLL